MTFRPKKDGVKKVFLCPITLNQRWAAYVRAAGVTDWHALQMAMFEYLNRHESEQQEEAA